MTIANRDAFRKLCAITTRTVTACGSDFLIKPLSLAEKRKLLDEATSFDKAGKAKIDQETYMVNVIVASCIDPKFEESDADFFAEDAEATMITELYSAIEAPVKLAGLDEKKSETSPKS